MASHLEKERADLNRADQAIAESERRITHQEGLIAKLRADGHDVTGYENVLDTFRATIKAQRDFRAIILERMSQLTSEEDGE